MDVLIIYSFTAAVPWPGAMAYAQHAFDSVAEGVENEAELRALKLLGVDAAQGFFLQRPISLAAALRLAREAAPRPN